MNVLKRGAVLLIFTFFLTTVVTHAQQVKFERSNFPGKEAELANALKNIGQGEDLFFEAETKLTGKGLDLRYTVEVKKTVAEALAYFQQANDFNPSSAPLNLMIGKCYLYLEESVRALEFFQRAKSLDEQLRDVDFLIGWCYQEMGDVDEAIAAYDEAMKRSTSLVTVNTITTKLKECRYAQSLMNDAMDLPVDNLEILSTPDADFMPIVMEKDEVLFFERFIEGDSRLYMSTRSAEGWGEAVPTGQTINIRSSEVLSEVTLLSPEGKPVTKKWFALNDDPRHTSARFLTVATVSADGNTAYFSSNRYSGFGGFDIYSTRKNRRGEWERPRNMGDMMNTPGDEYGVAVSPDGETLYFSSNGFPSMGGYDIYKSTYDGRRWSQAENLGYPVNSMANDVLNSVSADGNRLYFSSIRKGGKGDHDIYVVNYVPGVMPPITTAGPDPLLTAEAEKEPAAPSVEPEVSVSTAPEVSLRPVEMAISQGVAPKVEDMPVVKKPEVKQVASLRGVVTDNDSYQPVNTVLVLADVKGSAYENIQTDSQGVFQTTLTAGNTYKLTVEQEGYKPYAEEFTVDATGADLKLSKYIKLEPVAPKATETAMAEPVPAPVDPVPVVEEKENEEKYEDVLVLSPLFAAADEAEEKAVELKNEYPVQYTGLLSNNRTFQPIVSAIIRITNKTTNDETIVRSNAQGLYNFTVASGNSYTMVVESSGYSEYKEELVIPVKADPVINHPVQLTSLVTEELPDRAVSEVQSAPLIGAVTDGEDKPLANIALKFTDTITQATVSSVTDSNGEYTVMLPVSARYDVTVVGSGYEAINDNIIMPAEPTRRISKDFRLTALALPDIEQKIEEPVEAEVTTVAEATPVEPVVPEETAPVVEEPVAPVQEEPVAPVVEEPVPVVTEPVQPEPVVEEPQPVVEPEPVIEVQQPEPQPAVEVVPEPEPEPVVEVVPEPEPVVEEPQPEVEPEPVKETPQPVVQPEVTKAPSVSQIVLGGTVTGKSKQPVKATITVTNATLGLEETVNVDNRGLFRKIVQKGYGYSILVKADGYHNWVKDIPSFEGNDNMDIPVELKPVEETLLATVPFDVDRSSLNDDAMKILDNLLSTLTRDGQTVQIYSYTDSQGGDSYNTRLAERRLKSLLSYLHVKGVTQDKLSTQILGVNDPTATNLTMEGRRLNNRVEIRIKL